MQNLSSRFYGTAIIIAVLFFDQLTKFLITQGLTLGQIIPYGNWFNLVLRTNKGISFSLFSTCNLYTEIALVSFICVVMVWLIYQFLIAKQRWEIISFSLIIGGALGNLIDRLARGAVIDFLEFHIKGYYWPAFNVADSCIVIGVILILGMQTWHSWRQSSSKFKNSP